MTATAFTSLVSDPLPKPTRPYERVLHAFLRDFFEAYPVAATAIGYHAFDDRWSDMSEAGRVSRVASWRRHEADVRALAEDDLTAAERIDRGVLQESIEQMLFLEEVLREEAWDPLSTVYVLGSGLFSLLAREFAPWEHRGTAFLHRVQDLPKALEQAREALTGTPGRPVALLHTETAIAQLSGIGDLVEEGLAEARRRAEAGELANLPARLEPAAASAQEALESFRIALDTEVRDRAEGDGRLGAGLFQQKLRFTLASDLTFAELLERARRDYTAVRSEMVRIAREAWPQWMGDRPVPDAADGDETAENAIVQPVLDAIAGEHRKPDELLEWCRAEVSRIEQFCRERDLIGLADEPLKVTWTPVFMRAYGRAFLDAPGPLDKGLSSHFWITPPDESMGEEATESYLREDNDRMLRLLSIHEGVPGHYLQLAWSNRSPSLTRTTFTSGMFAEGWAVYVTQVMMDLGYGDHEPALLLNHWKFYLRAIINAIIDVSIHVEGMTEEEALDIMVRGGFQEPDEARAKWLRARLTSTQLSTYYLGSLEMWDLEVDARLRAARAAGASADAVPPQRVVGGLGETPGFDYRAHLESVISHGSPPIKWVRRILAEAAEAAEAAEVSQAAGAAS
ncbi:MAG: hypothetical protein QOH61_2281 [Chloroflexota bacterium]|jgi:uncharacterized protein (DUF885 family)|nr:hypothetical protein [Chloroflexota bacterium]